MKYTFAAVAIAALASAQSLSEVPECARDCLTKAVTSKTNCATDDFSCICKNLDTIQGSATSCVISACGTDAAINDVLPATEQLCKEASAGGSKSPAAAAKFSSAAAIVSSAPTSAAAGGGADATIDITITTTVCPTTTPVSIAAPANGTVPITTPTAPVTAGAVAIGSVGAVAMLVLGALAL